MNTKFAATAAASVAAAMNLTAHADDFHNKNLLVGDRAIGLGGGYAALSDDPSGMYYNPAGIVSATQLSSASVNAYTKAWTSYHNFYADSRAFTESSGGLVPGFFGILRHFDWGTAGFSIAVPDQVSESQTDTGPYATTVTYAGSGAVVTLPATGVSTFASDVDSATYYGGPSFARSFGEGQRYSAGITLYGTYRKARESRQVDNIYTASASSPAVAISLNDYTSYRTNSASYGIRPVIGIKAKLNEATTAGFTIAKEYSVSRSYQVNTLNYFAGSLSNSEGNTAFENHGSSQQNSSRIPHYPWQFTLGESHQWTPQLMTHAQIDYYTAANGDKTADINDGTRQLHPVADWTIGVDWKTTPVVSLRAAIFSSYSNQKNLIANSFERQEAIDLYGGSFGGMYKSAHYVFQAGIYGAIGSGYAAPGSLSTGQSNQPGYSYRLNSASKQMLCLYFAVEL